MYFNEVKENDIVYGLVFGKGKVIEVFQDSFYKFIVEFENGNLIPYTIDGIAKWGAFYEQTLFYKNDIDLTEVDFSPVKKVLCYKKIIKLRDKGELQVRLPSGIWANTEICNSDYIRKKLEKGKFHLFRKKI